MSSNEPRVTGDPQPARANAGSSALARWCKSVLGARAIVLGVHPTRRPSSQVIRVQSADGQQFVAKSHTNERRHDREVDAYHHWAPRLKGRCSNLVAAERSLPAVLLTALEGSPALDVLPTADEHFQLDVHRQAGLLLSRLHGTTETAPSDAAPSSLQERLARWLPQAHPYLNEAERSTIAALTTDLAHIDSPDTLRTAACHLDYQPRNWLISPEQLLHIVDFEHARYDYAVRDLSRLDTGPWLDAPHLREAFYDGYGRPPSEEEKAALIVCAAIGALSGIARAHDQADTALAEHAHSILNHLRASTSRPTRSAPPRAGSFAERLAYPDPTGRDLALLRGRLYRFSDNEHHYVMAEQLEENYLTGRPLHESTLANVRACLTQIRTSGTAIDVDQAVLAREDIDMEAELERRQAHRLITIRTQQPSLVVAVVGAPRSGTSHLVNLLAREGTFAYFTTASCWAWPTFNVQNPRRAVFSQLQRPDVEDILSVDNRATRILPSLTMPGEAEDIYARAIPTYRHIAGHRYELQPARSGAFNVLKAAASAHLQHFRTTQLLTKSPFNSLRIPILEKLWPHRVRYIHIVRDQGASADSMTRNGFEYLVQGRVLAPADAWSYFTSAVQQDAPNDRLLAVKHEDLIRDPASTMRDIVHWLTPATSSPTRSRGSE